MALFTDGPINQAMQLQNFENAILEVANTERIDLAGKSTLAQSEISNTLLLFLLRHQRRDYLFDFLGNMRRQLGVSDVVVSEPLRQWHAHKTLALVYRDAYNNQLNDRYKGKWTQYEQLAASSQQTYLKVGVGLTPNPMAKAAIPILSTAQAVGFAATYYTAVAWVNQAGQQGSASDPASITTTDGEQLVVAAGAAPVNAASWNAYIGATPTGISLQNGAPIAIGTQWRQTTGLISGTSPGDGQVATWFLTDDRVIERG